MAPDEIIEPKEPEREKKKDSLLRTLVDRDLEERMGAPVARARQRSEDPFWPVGLCIAWVLGRGRSEAVELYARHRVGLGVREVDGWREAQTAVLRALASGRIKASGFRPQDGVRVPVQAYEWIDLSILQRGHDDEARRLDGSIAYSDVRIEASEIRQEWRIETPAAKTVREKRAAEKACLSRLIERMRETPNHPIPKSKLMPQFPGVSERTFDRLFSEAARESGCVAWSMGGRRPSKKSVT
jgi:hypothetical protein